MKKFLSVFLLLAMLLSIGMLSACDTADTNTSGRETSANDTETASDNTPKQSNDTSETDSFNNLRPDMTGTKITAEDVEVYKKRDGVVRCYTEYFFENNSCITAIVYTTYTDESTAKYYYDHHIRRGENVQMNGCEVTETLSDEGNIMLGNSYYEVAVDLQVMEYTVTLE